MDSALIIKIAFDMPEGLRDADDWNILDYRTFFYRGKSYNNYLDALYDIPRQRWNDACLILYRNNIFINKISTRDTSLIFTLLDEYRRERDYYSIQYLKDTHSYFNE